MREVVMAVVAEHVDGRDAEYRQRRQGRVADQPPRRQVGEAEHHGQQQVAQQADHHHADARHRAQGRQRPGEQGRRAHAVGRQPMLREQGLLGVVHPERRPDPQAHAEVRQQIRGNEERDAARRRPGWLCWHGRPKACFCGPLLGGPPAKRQ
jgi:hypothetical protein